MAARAKNREKSFNDNSSYTIEPLSIELYRNVAKVTHN